MICESCKADLSIKPHLPGCGRHLNACGRCDKSFPLIEAKTCWYCMGVLCGECWEEFGHCGHPQAIRGNLSARKKKQFQEKRQGGE